MDMSKNMEHQPYPVDDSEKLMTALVIVGAGSLIENAEGRTVSDQYIRIGWDVRIGSHTISLRALSEGAAIERSNG